MPQAESSDPTGWAKEVADAALGLGFARVGFAPAQRFERGAKALTSWLDAGLNGEMAYLRDHSDRADPRTLLPGAKTLVVVALSYSGGGLVELRKPGAALAHPGYVAAYARGADYHTVMRPKLNALARACSQIFGREVLARACVDTAPLLEREAAWLAGVGFTGKNTLSIAPGLGSYFMLGELVLDVELPQSLGQMQGCGKCRSCLDACPTQAFVSEYVLDARRCISYLTIEYRGVIPRELRALMGNHVFGCDICQAVCPYNAGSETKPTTPGLPRKADYALPELLSLLELTSSGYRRFARRTAMRRIPRACLARNAAIALGNSGDPSAIPPLLNALHTHLSPLVRGHAAWALGRLGKGDPASGAEGLVLANAREGEAWVREEIEWALSEMQAPCFEEESAEVDPLHLEKELG